MVLPGDPAPEEAVGSGVWPGVAVGAAVGGFVGVLEGDLVGELLDAEPDHTITSCGGLAPSRDESETAVLFVVESPKLNVPLPVIADVTPTLVQVPAAILPELPSLLVPNGGELALVMLVSPQVPSATE